MAYSTVFLDTPLDPKKRKRCAFIVVGGGGSADVVAVSLFSSCCFFINRLHCGILLYLLQTCLHFSASKLLTYGNISSITRR